jgi:hypothetical protein
MEGENGPRLRASKEPCITGVSVLVDPDTPALE